MKNGLNYKDYNMKVKIKKLNERAVIPKYQKLGDAGLDLTATTSEYDYNKERYVIGTGLAVEIPEGHVGLIFPRSSICKYDMRLTNCVGVIDSNYRGEIMCYFESKGFGGFPKVYAVGERVAQMIILPILAIEFEEVSELSDTVRGDKGFGSSN